MPCELSFTKRVAVAGPARYITECGVGGDIVSAALLPALRARYGQVDAGEEDWGWFMASTRGGLRLAVDVLADDYGVGRFRVRIATSGRGLLFGRREINGPALEELKPIVLAGLTSWLGQPPSIAHID